MRSLRASACARRAVAASPARGLTELAEQEGADLVVIGSSRHAEPGRIRLERTTGRLLEGAPCAVAVAPGALREPEAFHHVGVAYDGSPEARSALLAGYDIAVRSGAVVTLLCALPSPPTSGFGSTAARSRRSSREPTISSPETAPTSRTTCWSWRPAHSHARRSPARRRSAAR